MIERLDHVLFAVLALHGTILLPPKPDFSWKLACGLFSSFCQMRWLPSKHAGMKHDVLMPASKNVAAWFSHQCTTDFSLAAGALTNLLPDAAWSKLSRHSELAVGKRWRGARLCHTCGKHAWVSELVFFWQHPFPPQLRALFERLNFQKCSEPAVLTSKCALRHSAVHFLNISTSVSAPKLKCF